MNSAPAFGPMAMGEMLDRSATFWRANVGPLFRLYLGFQLFQYVLMKLYTFALYRWFPLMLGGARTATALEENPTEALTQLLTGWASGAGIMLIYFLITWYSSVAVSAFVLSSLMGTPVGLPEAFHQMRKQAWPIFVTYLLSVLWGIGITLGLSVPGVAVAGLGMALANSSPAAWLLVGVGGILVLLGVVAAMMWYLLRFFLLGQVLAAEELSVVEAVRRAGALVAGRVGTGFANLVKVRATILLSVVMLILSAVSVLSGLPAMIVSALYGNALDPMNASPEKVPQALLIPAELLQVLATSLFAPLFVVLAVMFYLDMRSRREGLDLELRLKSRGVPGT